MDERREREDGRVVRPVLWTRIVTSVKVINQISFLLPTRGIPPSPRPAPPPTVSEEPERTKSDNLLNDRLEFFEREDTLRDEGETFDVVPFDSIDQIDVSSSKIRSERGAINPYTLTRQPGASCQERRRDEPCP